MLVGSDHQMPVRVGELVEDHERVPAAVDDQVRLVIFLGRLGAEDASLLCVLRGVLHVREAPGRPDPLVCHMADPTSPLPSGRLATLFQCSWSRSLVLMNPVPRSSRPLSNGWRTSTTSSASATPAPCSSPSPRSTAGPR